MTSRAAIESTATGGRLGTVTRKLSLAASPPGSVAVTVTSTVPFATATTVITVPSIETARRFGSAAAAEYRSGCPSGSLKRPATSTTAESPTINSRSSMVPTAFGGRFGTRTWKLCRASRPPGSVATTVTTAVPGATAVIVTVLPATWTVATPTSELNASKSSASPLGSRKHRSTTTVSPTAMVWSGSVPHSSGDSGFSHETIQTAAARSRASGKVPRGRGLILMRPYYIA